MTVANTTTSVVSSVNPSISGQSTTSTATVAAVAPGGGTAAGTVQFMDGASRARRPATLSGDTATLSTSALTIGTPLDHRGVRGDANYNTSTSSAPTQTVRDTTTTVITSDAPDPSALGGSYTVGVSVTRGGRAVSPTGTVTVSDGAGSCNATLAGSGETTTGSCSLASTTAGAKTLTAT